MGQSGSKAPAPEESDKKDLDASALIAARVGNRPMEARYWKDLIKVNPVEGLVLDEEANILTIPAPPLPEGHKYLRFVCISDTHTKTTNLKLPAGDVLIHAGDFTSTGTMKEINYFNQFLAEQTQFRYKVVIAGNHDITFHREYYLAKHSRFHSKPFDVDEARAALKDCIYLEDSMVEIEGLRIWGSPWQPEFCDWAFNLDRGAPIKEKWDLIPANTDILITHGPPIGHGDKTPRDELTGCTELMEVIKQIKPKYHIFGHIHEGFGVTRQTDIPGVTFVNASTCTYHYRPTNPCVVFDVPVPINAANAATELAAGAGAGAAAAPQ